jgi:hypothetical protein
MVRDHVELINVGKYYNFCGEFLQNNIKTDLSNLGCENVDWFSRPRKGLVADFHEHSK